MNAEKRIEHLRKTHFALILACAVLIVASALPNPWVYRRALQQAIEISAANDAWNGAEFVRIRDEAIERHLDRQSAGQVLPSTPVFLCFDRIEVPYYQEWTMGRRIDAVLSRPLEQFVIRAPTTASVMGDYAAPEVAREVEQSTAFHSLTEFKALWNYLADARFVVAKGDFDVESVRLRCYPYNLGESVQLLSNVRVSASDCGSSWKGEAHCALEGHGREAPEYVLTAWDTDTFEGSVKLEVPVATDCVWLDGQRALTGLNEQTGRWNRGPFRRSFRELYSVLDDRYPDELGALIATLEKEADDEHETVELLGVKIPHVQVTIWGGLFLAGFQLYFWLHYREAIRTGTALDAAPWIGGYDDSVARWVTAISVLLLPAVVATALACVGFTSSDGAGRIGPVAAAAPSLTLAVLTSFAVWQSWRGLSKRGA